MSKALVPLADGVEEMEAVREFVRAGRLTAAICAAPLVLQAAGVLAGRRATCHPAVRSRLTAAIWCPDRVVVDLPVVTSQGPGTAFDFALRLVELRDGEAARNAVRQGLVL